MAVNEHGMAEVERGLAGDAADLIVADGEFAGLPGAAKISAVTPIDLTGHRHAAAKDVAVSANDSQVGIGRMAHEQIREEFIAAGGAVAVAYRGESRQARQQFARALDQPLVIRGCDTGQPERVLLHLRLSELALFEVCVEA